MVLRINSSIDNLWITIVMLEITAMQLGFILLEVGTIRAKNSRNIIYKNLMDLMVSTITYWLIGYGVATGGLGGLMGIGQLCDFGFKDQDYSAWIISYCFCTTTCTIISGALAERTFLDTYVYFTFTMAALIYPVISSWVWGGGWL